MPRPRKRLRVMARDAAESFDTTICANRVYDQVNGAHDRHNDLLEVLELAERCYDLSDERDDRGVVSQAAFDAAETLNDQIDAVRDEQIAQACAVIVQEADGWTDVWSGTQISDAVDEAEEWLREHPSARDRAGVGMEVLDR